VEAAACVVPGRFRRVASQVLSIFQECKNMPLLNVVFALIVVGVTLWLINRFIPMASSIKTILNVVVVVAVCVWVLQAVGLWGQVSSFRLGR
jgi:predicted membrane protein